MKNAHGSACRGAPAGAVLKKEGHMAKFDIIAATGCPTGIAHTFMAKEELFEINPIFSWLISKLGAFPVRRGAKDNTAIEKALESLGEGRIFVIFPEGTRSKDGTLGRAKSGVTLIAAQAKVPVVPVYIQYGRKKFRQNIYISIGEKIPAKHFDVDISDRKMLKQVSSTIMDEIAKLRENMPDVD